MGVDVLGDGFIGEGSGILVVSGLVITVKGRVSI